MLNHTRASRHQKSPVQGSVSASGAQIPYVTHAPKVCGVRPPSPVDFQVRVVAAFPVPSHLASNYDYAYGYVSEFACECVSKFAYDCVGGYVRDCLSGSVRNFVLGWSEPVVTTYVSDDHCGLIALETRPHYRHPFYVI